MEKPRISPYIYFIIILVAALGYGFYLYQKQSDHVSELLELADVQERKIAQLEGIIETQANYSNSLATELSAEKNRNEEFAQQIGEIAGTVGTLEKLSQTDEELLQKYSKVYFLNEHYTPSHLSQLENEYLYDENQDQYIHSRVLPYLEDMILDAKDDDVTLYIRSAYRSFGTQSQLKSNYSVTYGSGANTFSADQGYSEHQLGTTVDFTTTGINGGLTGFQNTKAYEWLRNNAHKYGFVLSYPPNNDYYIFEPWHWRFVGVDLATHLHGGDIYFYDMEQREIDEYLVNIFD
ncbi:MAG: hypothetical protein COV34_02455 [Candidatus Zambryskibacteria bacterium CG10_big_fil_rev_8_21_14_0_10_42_12]|uniref:D-alanyl-D-alanine carboxypeptidase-like core domain-containing protein n=1 Tax=Candidatus Zambryskibacteria bacterium CG10_big_fil_rev_8_21_14_0_10_42_12 TaxID=1975115 RepID=A0A2H0QVF2_9BACT|nr:MAG: hypothetical protein COV34_02455 [Candidatus Zambryskibacteria bacterium CG10_big_fil_rev_8_21_14_0_10_42_12]